MKSERPLSTLEDKDRMDGLDLARGIAMFFMVIVNFRLIFYHRMDDSVFLNGIIDFFEGRAATLFVLVSGAGFSILISKVTPRQEEFPFINIHWLIVKRSFLLMVMGAMLSFVWPLDILHVYSAFLLIGSFVHHYSNRVMIFLTFITFLLFIGLMFCIDYNAHWLNNGLPFSELLYLPDLFRYYLFEGVYPLLPWVTIFLMGMLLGRIRPYTLKMRKQYLMISISTVFTIEMIAQALINYHTQIKYFSISKTQSIPVEFVTDSVKPWIYVRPFPPTPFFILSSIATAIAVLMISMMAADHYKHNKWIHIFINFGQFSLTFYIAHILTGILPLQMMGYDEKLNLIPVVIYALIYLSMSLWLSNVYRKKIGRGILEQVLRRI